MKIFEVEITKVHDILMRQTNSTSDQTSSSAVESVDESSNSSSKSDKSKTAKKKHGRPITTNRKDDEELYRVLRNNPEGKDVHRTEWQVQKWNKFKSG